MSVLRKTAIGSCVVTSRNDGSPSSKSVLSSTCITKGVILLAILGALCFSVVLLQPNSLLGNDHKLAQNTLSTRRTTIETSLETPWPVVRQKNWCVPKRIPRPKDVPITGMVYVKVYKTSSSTSAGVAIRISQEVGKRELSHGQVCDARYSHGVAWKRELGKRNKERSFMWSMVRDPTRRALSHVFFFTITQGHKEPTDEQIVNGMKRATPEGRGGFQVNYLSTYRYEENLSSSNMKGVEEVVDSILDDYDFLGVAERYDESIVALRLILGIEASDILHFNSKVGGGYDMRCNKIVKSFTTEVVDEFIDSEDWKERNVGDSLLFEAANRKLDSTIESIGKEKFEKALAEHRGMMKLAQDRCEGKVLYPCTDGRDTSYEAQFNCYARDFGCGYRCIDKLIQEGALSL